MVQALYPDLKASMACKLHKIGTSAHARRVSVCVCVSTEVARATRSPEFERQSASRVGPDMTCIRLLAPYLGSADNQLSVRLVCCACFSSNCHFLPRSLFENGGRPKERQRPVNHHNPNTLGGAVNLTISGTLAQYLLLLCFTDLDGKVALAAGVPRARPARARSTTALGEVHFHYNPNQLGSSHQSSQHAVA